MPIITPEQLDEDLQEEQELKSSILKEVRNLFSEAGSELIQKLNTISFEQSTDTVKSLFSIDNTTFDYVSYITVEGSNSSNYSSKGDINGIVDAAVKFISELNDILVDADIDDEDEVRDYNDQQEDPRYVDEEGEV